MRHTNLPFAGLALFLGAAQFTMSLFIAEALVPTHNAGTHEISLLGVGPAAALFNTSVILLGLAIVVGAYFLFRAGGRVLPILLVLTGIGAVGVGVFPYTSPAPHYVSAFIAFLFGGVAAIVSYRACVGFFRYASIGLGVLALVAFVLFALDLYLGLGRGGMERVIVYPILIYGIGFGAHLMVPAASP